MPLSCGRGVAEGRGEVECEPHPPAPSPIGEGEKGNQNLYLSFLSYARLSGLDNHRAITFACRKKCCNINAR
jgi:hypothetical protein